MFQPYAQLLKKHFYEMLKEKYHVHDTAIERIAAHVAIQKDAEEIMKLINAVYEAGFVGAVDSYRDQLKSLGYRVDVVTQTTESGR